jgi:outer membrane protein assembly factor BamB
MSLTSRFPLALRRAGGLTLAVVALATLVACGSSKPSPASLESFKPTARLSVLWSQRVGAIDGPMTVAITADAVVSASSGGEVRALALADGHTLWRFDTKADLSALLGSDGRYVAVVSDNNDLLVYDQGKLIWQERQSGRVITAPLIAGERVFVQGVDRAVRAYDVLDGRWLWQYQRPGGEPLALGTSVVMSPFRDTLLAAQGARLLGLDPLKGTVRFDVNVGTPRGTNEVERLADLVGPLARVDDDEACVRVFQLSVACLELNRGSVRWSRPQAGQQAVAANSQWVVGADGADRLTAWKVDNGDFAWRVDRFTYRGLSAPVLWRDKVAVADRDGYLHLLSTADGSTVARYELDSALATAPRVVQDKLMVVTRKGTVYALALN